jgi:hypothetical protein
MGALIIYAVGAALCLWLVILLLPALGDRPRRRPRAHGRPATKVPTSLQSRVWKRLRSVLVRWRRQWLGQRLPWFARHRPVACGAAALAGAVFIVLSALAVTQAVHLFTPDSRDGAEQLTRIAAANERIARAVERPPPDAPPSGGSVTVVSEDLARMADALEGDPDVIATPPRGGGVNWISVSSLFCVGLLFLYIAYKFAGRIGSKHSRLANIVETGLAILSFLLGSVSVFGAVFGALFGEFHLSPFTGFTLFQKVEIHQIMNGGSGVAAVARLSSCGPGLVHRFGTFETRADRRLNGQGDNQKLMDTESVRNLRRWLETVKPAHLLVIGSTDESRLEGPDHPAGNASLAARRARAVSELIAAMPLAPRPSIIMANDEIGVARLTRRRENETSESVSGRQVILCALGPVAASDEA